MSINITSEDGNGKRTVTFTYTADGQKVLDTADDLGKRVFSRYQPNYPMDTQWDDLTNQEKLTMCFQAATRLIIAQAKSAYINEQQGAARDTATEYAESEYCLE